MAKSKRKVRQGPVMKPRVRAAGPASSQPTIWERVPPRVQHALAISFLLLVTLGFFWPVTFGGMSLIGGDTVQWRGMAEAMIEYEEATGDRALWAPNGFAGMPGYLIHYPKEVLQIDRIPSWLRALGWWPGAHFFVMLLGTYILVVFLARDAIAATVASVAFGFTAYIPIILTAGHNTKFIALAFAPWLVLAFVYALRRPPGQGWMRAGLAALFFAVVLAANLRAEHVQITYYVAFGLGIVWVVEGVGAVRDGSWKPFLISTGVLAVGSILAVLMVAHPYMATAEYREFTIRGGQDGGLDWSYAMNWSQGIGELITLIIPGAYGQEGMTYWGPKPFTAGPHYVGGLVLVLAGLALYGVRRRIVAGLGIAGAIMVLFSLGEHLPLLNRPMFEVFPLFDAFRVPETWLSVVALVVAILAGAGTYYLGRREAVAESVERKTRATYIGMGVVVGFILLMLFGRDLLFSFESPGELQQLVAGVAAQSGVPEADPRVEQAARSFLNDLKDERRAMFTDDAARALLFLVLGGVLIAFQRHRRIPGWAMQVGLLLLITVDLWQVDRRFFNPDHPAIRTTGDIQRAIPEYGVDRFILAQEAVAGGSGHFRTLPLALNPFNDGRTPYFYESVGGYHGAKLGLFQDYIDDLLFAPEGGFTPHGLDLTATRFLITRGTIPGFEQVFEDPTTGLAVLEKPDAMPRAWFVEQVEVIPDREGTYARLLDPSLNLRRTAVLAEEPATALAAAPIDTAAAPSVQQLRFTPREILWEVETDRPRLLVVSEVYYPAGWVARIGRDEVPIHRTNHLLRGVVVPEGRHHLSMRFEPRTHMLSVNIASISTILVYLALAILVGFTWYRRGEDE